MPTERQRVSETKCKRCGKPGKFEYATPRMIHKETADFDACGHYFEPAEATLAVPPAPNETTPVDGASLIAAERQRQMQVEGWTPEHDDEHTDSSLVLAAICYCTPVRLFWMDEDATGFTFEDPWPSSWDDCWDRRFKYGERRTNPGNVPPDPQSYSEEERLDLLVKAGALIAAEIDRLQRAALEGKRA